VNTEIKQLVLSIQLVCIVNVNTSCRPKRPFLFGTIDKRPFILSIYAVLLLLEMYKMENKFYLI